MLVAVVKYFIPEVERYTLHTSEACHIRELF